MAIEDIFKALEEQADAEVNQILHVATVQADAIEHEARDEADRITKSRIAAAEDAVRTKASKAVNASRLQVRRDLAAVRDTAVESVFAMATEQLAAMRGTAAYERVFTELAKEALADVDSECEVKVSPADEQLARRVVEKLGAACVVTPSLETIGGLAVAMHAGRVVRMNTFESRLHKVRSLAGAKVAEVMTS